MANLTKFLVNKFKIYNFVDVRPHKHIRWMFNPGIFSNKRNKGSKI